MSTWKNVLSIFTKDDLYTQTLRESHQMLDIEPRHLAQSHPAVCRFDLAFLARASGEHVEHSECIVRGGSICRFRFSPRGNGADTKP